VGRGAGRGGGDGTGGDGGGRARALTTYRSCRWPMLVDFSPTGKGRDGNRVYFEMELAMSDGG
jgi:hypothetical protein